MAKVQTIARVVRRDDGATDWNGRKTVRLDCRDHHGRDVHLYLPAKHPLAGLKVGGQLVLTQV